MDDGKNDSQLRRKEHFLKRILPCFPPGRRRQPPKSTTMNGKVAPQQDSKNPPSNNNPAADDSSEPPTTQNSGSRFLEKFQFSAAHAKNDPNAPVYLCGLYKGYLAIDTSQNSHYYWLFVIFCAVLYNIIFVVGRAIFWEMGEYFPVGWYIIDYTFDLSILSTFLSECMRATWNKGSWSKTPKSCARTTSILQKLSY